MRTGRTILGIVLSPGGLWSVVRTIVLMSHNAESLNSDVLYDGNSAQGYITKYLKKTCRSFHSEPSSAQITFHSLLTAPQACAVGNHCSFEEGIGEKEITATRGIGCHRIRQPNITSFAPVAFFSHLAA